MCMFTHNIRSNQIKWLLCTPKTVNFLWLLTTQVEKPNRRMDNQPSPGRKSQAPMCVKGRLEQGPCWQKCVSHLQVAVARVLGTRSALSTARPVWVLTQALGVTHSLRLSPNSPMGAWPSPHPWLGMSECLGGEGAKLKGLRGMWTEREATGHWLSPRLEQPAASGQSETERRPRTKATEANHACSHCQGKGPVGRAQASAPTTFSQERTPENHAGSDCSRGDPHNIWAALPPHADTHSHTQADFHTLPSPTLGSFFCFNRYFKKQKIFLTIYQLIFNIVFLTMGVLLS